MENLNLLILDESPIVLSSGFELSTREIASAINLVNKKFYDLEKQTEAMAFNIFEVIDFRMLSGLVGETLVSALSTTSDSLRRNPNIDGYPDLLDVSKKEFLEDYTKWSSSDARKFIKYPHGGIEIKNTFGTKKAGADLDQGESRIEMINKKLDWKAHHKYTNNLLALLSDFVEGRPQIIAAFYTDKLVEFDWADKQNPKEGSTMTSFSVIKSSGNLKLRKGLKVCLNDPRYLTYFGLNI